jgi:nucleotide-binding universal stress UspA family protein
MIRIKNVLVATDFSEPSAVALDYGRELARTYGAKLHVLHIVEDLRWRYATDMAPTALVGIQEDVEASAASRLETILTDEDRKELGVHAAALTAIVPSEAIVQYAKNEGVDVIVMGTHGRSGLAHLFMGSVAERVVRLSPCPVLTVRHPQHEFIAPDALVSVAKA